MTVDQFKRLDERLDMLCRCILAHASISAKTVGDDKFISEHFEALDKMMQQWPHKS